MVLTLYVVFDLMSRLYRVKIAYEYIKNPLSQDAESFENQEQLLANIS